MLCITCYRPVDRMILNNIASFYQGFVWSIFGEKPKMALENVKTKYYP